MVKQIVVLLVLACFQASASDKPLQVAVNIGPPWAFYEEGAGVVGIDVDIIRHITSELGYDAEFHLLAYNRLIADYRAGKYDIASPAAFEASRGYLTQAYLPFEDVAVSLADSNYSLNSVNDLTGKRVIAYQSAKSVLGPEFARAVEGDGYLEKAERIVQLRLLVNDRADVVVGERRLLTYIMQKNFPDTPLAVHPIFQTRPYGAIVKDPQLRKNFNRVLSDMRASGVYQEILDRWQ